MLRRWSVGRGEQRPALLCPELRRGEGGAHGEGDWEAGDRAAAGHGGRAVQAALVNDGSEGPGYVSLGQGRSDHSGCKGSCGEEGGGHEVGGGDEEGEEGPVDGVPVGARLGKTGQLPYSGMIELKP